MTATVLNLPRALKLECSICGASADAACECGASYMPARTRAIEAVKANPGKSDRAIAHEIGLGCSTVNRARKAGAPGGAPEKRIGRDGKAYRLPTRVVEQENPENYRTVFLLRADQAIQLAVHSGPITAELVAAAHKVAEKWTKLAKKMEEYL